MPWIIGGVCVAIVAAVAIVLVLVMGGSSKSGPAAAVSKFLKAAQNNDANAARDVTCDPLHSQINGNSDTKIKSFKVGDGKQNGNSATVPFTVTSADGDERGVASVQRQGGTWKVCDITETGSGSGGGTAPGTGSASLPSGLPTDLPSGFPTDLPSGFPTDFPTDLPTDFPTSFPTS